VSAVGAVDLVFLWHHHQPDYRSPRDGTSQLPWVRLHATKDYLDMALRLERFPRVRAAFNFVPTLLDQLEDASRGGPDTLFDALAMLPGALEGEERLEVARRCSVAPRWAFDRFPAYQALATRISAGGALNDAELLGLECHFLLGWLDPMFHDQPEAARARAESATLRIEHRDALLALHRRLTGEVVAAYRARAEAGQVELSASPYCHPILPLLIDTRHARRARPDLPLPAETFSAPEDASAQIERALARHAQVFGMRPEGMWPSEGSVSPEAATLAARAGVRWLATDEGVLWASLPPEQRTRERLYRPWRLLTEAGEIALVFRDHELSDRIGFVYSRWSASDAVNDFLERVRRIGREQRGTHTPLVCVILDGENCWEQYPDDGGPFLDGLYAALEAADDIRTRTPSEAIAARAPLDVLPGLHSGSWIDADFHIWIGHPEKNRAWDLLARARRALVEGRATPESHPRAWEALFAAEGSDWFWWFGDDHYTSDRALFDRIFREHLQAVYEHAGRTAPAELRQPVAGARLRADGRPPIGFVAPRIDGRRTGFYEWHGAGVITLGSGGGSMHHGGGRVRELHYGFDSTRIYLRLDPAEGSSVPQDLGVEVTAPVATRVRVDAAGEGGAKVTDGAGAPVPGAEAAFGEVVEIALPFAALGARAGEPLEVIVHVLEHGAPIESLPEDGTLRIAVPDSGYVARTWSAS
jgi:alpha-amylase/alpha-mannosidase (GH57 family)